GLIVPSTSVRGRATSVTLTDVDPFYAAYFFLTGLHERGLEQPGQAAPGQGIAQWGGLDQPVIDLLVAQLADSWQSLPGLRAGRPGWPSGKRWALALSHDCDRPLRNLTTGYLRDVPRFLARREPLRSVNAAAKAVFSGLAALVADD